MATAPDLQALLWDMPSEQLQLPVDAGLAVNAPDEFGNYSLTVACHRLQVESVKVLLQAGADPNVRNAERDTPLLCAIDCVAHDPAKAIQIVEILVSAGANLELRGFMDKTPYLKAYSRNNLDMLKTLVRLGADHQAVVIDGGPMNGTAFADILSTAE